jgi:hypothetical protein
MATGMNVWVNIGAKLLPSINSAATGIEKRFGLMNRRLKIQAAETKLAYKEMAAAMKPLAALAVAGGLSAGFKGILGEGAEYQHEITMMRAAGRTAKEMAAAIGAANRTIVDVPTSTINGNLRMLQETTLAFGGIEHAIENLQFNTRMGAMMKNIMGEDYDEVGGFNQLVRALEIRGGKMKAADYQRQAGLLYKAMAVSGGTVNPENILGFMQQAGVAARGYNERFLTSVAPSLIQEFGGERAGTMATAMFNQFMGRVPIGGKALTEEWIRLGLVPPNGTPQNLSVKGWDPGSLKGNAIAMSNPLEWIETVMMPAMRAHGINTNDKNQMLLQAQKMFGRETGKRLASTLFDPKQLERIHADQKLYDKAMGPDAAFTMAMKNDPKMALASTAASLKNLETNLGKSLFSPAGLAAINNVARAINWLAGAFDKHPNFARGVSALVGLGTVWATARLFGIKLTSVLTGLLSLLGKGFFRLLPMVGNMLVAFFRTGLWRILYGGGRWIVVALARLGPWIVRGLLALVPEILEGIAAAVAAILGAPIWVTIAIGAAVIAAGALIWHFRDAIGSFFARSWGSIKGYFLNHSWGQIGYAIALSIADGLSGGLFSRMAAIANGLANWWKAHAPTVLGGAGTPGVSIPIGLKGVPKGPDAAMRPGGMKATGGTVTPGHWYGINEKGQEYFAPGRTGTIIPHSEIKKAGGRGADPREITFYINGATDPQAVARAVRAELARLSTGNSAYLND